MMGVVKLTVLVGTGRLWLLRALVVGVVKLTVLVGLVGGSVCLGSTVTGVSDLGGVLPVLGQNRRDGHSRNRHS